MNQIKNPKIKFCSYECSKKHKIPTTFTPEQKMISKWLREFEMDLEAVITDALETADELKACKCGKAKR